MAKFGKRSKEILHSVDVKLVRILGKVIEFYDFTVISGMRNKEEQDTLYREGRSKKLYPNSKHNSWPSKAVDIAPYPVDWEDNESFYFLAGMIKAVAYLEGIKVRWGGDWDSDNDLHDQTFFDLGHFELEE